MVRGIRQLFIRTTDCLNVQEEKYRPTSQRPGIGNGTKSVTVFVQLCNQAITEGQNIDKYLRLQRGTPIQSTSCLSLVRSTHHLPVTLHPPCLWIPKDTRSSKSAHRTKNSGLHAKNFSTPTAITSVRDFEEIGSLPGAAQAKVHCIARTARFQGYSGHFITPIIRADSPVEPTR